MATGIEMMMKSMGVDPDKIKLALTNARDEIMAQVQSINDKLDLIAAKQDALEVKVNAVLYPVQPSEQPASEGGTIDGIGDQPNTLKEQLQKSLLKVN
jgi:hypothetical protein